MNKTITAREAPEVVLRAILRLLRYQPTESLVVHTLTSDGTRTAVRVDLPRPDESTQLARQTLMRTLRATPSPEATTLVAYTDASWTAAGEHATHLRELAIALEEEASLTVDQVLLHSSHCWGDPFNPAETHPAAIASPARTLEAATHFPTVTPAQVRTFQHGLLAARGRTLHTDAAGPRSVSDLVDDALRSSSIRATAALHASILDHQGNRDIALHTIAWGRAPVGAGAMTRATTADALQYLIGHGHAPRPDQRRVARGIETLRLTAALAREPQARATALAMVGWLCYAIGAGSLASVYAGRALSLSPDHEFAEFVSVLADRGQVPDWLISGN